MTTKILSAIEEFESAGAKATQGEWKFDGCGDVYTLSPDARRRMRFDDYGDGNIGSTSYWSEGNQNAKFACAAANKATLFTQALKVAVEALDKYKHTDLSTESGVWGYVGSEAIAFKALAEIERILEMENDGSTIDRPISY